MLKLKVMSVVGAIALGACGGSPDATTADVCQDVLGMIPAQCDCFDVNLEADFDAQTIGKTYEALGQVSDDLSLIQSMRSVELDQRSISDVLTISERCKMDSSWGAAGSN